MELIIRDAREEDAGALQSLSLQLDYTISLAAVRKNIETILSNGHELVRVAAYDQKIVGWIHVFYTTRIESLPFCEIGGLIIDEQYRNSGLGKRLVNDVKSWCLAKGASSLRVRCNIKRREAHDFYLHIGFRETKQQTVFHLDL